MNGCVRASALMIVLALSGCGSHAHSPATHPAVEGFSPPQYFSDVQAVCDPPIGWTLEPLKQSPQHTHLVWISPSGKTAYGVIHFSLPFPVASDLVLWVFLNEMRRTERASNLIDKRWDQNLPGLRFVAEGGEHKVRTNLFVRGFDGWAVYAGTKVGENVLEDELSLAERAREMTEVGGK